VIGDRYTIFQKTNKQTITGREEKEGKGREGREGRRKNMKEG
jgi:hypothetical protein